MAGLSKKELAICRRLARAREQLCLTQGACADQLRIQRGSLANYEIGRSPIRHELALKFCHQFIVSEDWLATGLHGAMRTAEKEESIAAAKGMSAVRSAFGGKRVDPDFADPALDSIFFRQCMDLIAEPVCRRIPPGTLYSTAYLHYLEPVYAKLARTFYHVPRIVYDDTDHPARNAHIIDAYTERWLKMAGNEAMRKGGKPIPAQNEFTRMLLAAGGQAFLKFIEAQTPPASAVRPETVERD